jgi:hypothetical protein
VPGPALTNKEIAQRLEANPATVLHHVRTLVDTGFLAAQPARRGTRGSREVPYLATRKSWRLDLSGKTDGVGDGRTRSSTRSGTSTSARAGISRLGLRLTREHVRVQRAPVRESSASSRPAPAAGGRAYSVFSSPHEDVTRDLALELDLPVRPQVDGAEAHLLVDRDHVRVDRGVPGVDVTHAGQSRRSRSEVLDLREQAEAGARGAPGAPA